MKKVTEITIEKLILPTPGRWIFEVSEDGSFSITNLEKMTVHLEVGSVIIGCPEQDEE